MLARAREGGRRSDGERERERPFPKTFEARAVEVLIFPLASRNPLEKKKKTCSHYSSSPPAPNCASLEACVPLLCGLPFPPAHHSFFAQAALCRLERGAKKRESKRETVASSRASRVRRHACLPQLEDNWRPPRRTEHLELLQTKLTELLNCSRSLGISQSTGRKGTSWGPSNSFERAKLHVTVVAAERELNSLCSFFFLSGTNETRWPLPGGAALAP